MNPNELTEQATERSQETAERVKETAQTIKERAQDLTQKARNKLREVGAATDRYVREYAWTTLAVVAITAGLLGFMLGRRQR
jgi:ElaB/YqjD/DUF883 family membrane-anchored ribosome-binding protein